MAKAKSKQLHLADMAPPVVPEIEDAADAFKDARDAWQKKHKPMMEAREKLMGLLKEHGIEQYEYNRDGVDYVAILSITEGVKVKTKKAESNGEAE